MFQFNFNDDKCETNDDFQTKLKVDQVSIKRMALDYVLC